MKKRRKDSARLVWDSKPKRAPNPRDIEFQTAEIVVPNPKRDLEQLPLSFKDNLFGQDDIDKQSMNRLVWGDNLLAMQALINQGYENKINMIYIDPPFSTGENYSYLYKLEDFSLDKEPSILERLAYKNTWASGIDSYMDFIYPRLALMRRLLTDNGVLFVRFDYHVGHYVKILLDEIFGINNFKGELIVKRIKKGVTSQGKRSMPIATDSIYIYFKSQDSKFHNIEKKRDEIRPGFWRHFDDSSGIRKPRERKIFEKVYLPPPGKHFKFSQARVNKMVEEEKIRINPRTGKPEYWVEPSTQQPLDTNWTDIPGYTFSSGYPTENSEVLLERIIEAGSKEGDLIADFYSGSGTTISVAEKKKRRWVGCELGKVGIQVARNRLVKNDAKPFLVENIGNYQREMIYLTGSKIKEMQRVILKLYNAVQRKDTSDLGTRMNEESKPELVHVGYPDRPVTAKKAEEILKIAEKLDGSGYKKVIILAWDYEPNFDQAFDARKKSSKKWPKVQMEARMIPSDIYDYLKKAKNEDELEKFKDNVQFFEKPYLKLSEPVINNAGQSKCEVSIKIERYIVFDFPVKKQEDREKLREIAKDDFAMLIDYWSVDWGFDGFTFKSQWQEFRGFGKKAKKVLTVAREILDSGKEYEIAVRVVDIFGNDASASTKIKLKGK